MNILTFEAQQSSLLLDQVMEDVIHLLPDAVANQIAAGEVIQRPASVVKELMENAVDAGSSIIKVIIKDGGKTLIQVIDNGCGMSATDSRMSIERHATSKIREAGDLFAIRTLGFRGEALASIAAVAEVILRTCRHDSDLGTELVVSGSRVETQKSVSCPPGTSFNIRNLFFNVPARRKFLKSTNAEFRHIIHEFQRIALVNPQVELYLEHNEDEIYNLPRTNLRQRIIHIFGKTINQNLTEIHSETSLVRISGYTGKPEFARKTPGEQFFFVNNRYMRHPYFHRAIISAYEKVLPPETIPTYFIYLDTDPETIDINIHPTKTEIKFENELAVFQILVAATREALGRFNLIPSIDFDTESSIEIPVVRHDIPVSPPGISFNPDYNPFEVEPGYKGRTPFRRNNDLDHWERLYATEGFPKRDPSFQAPEEQSTLSLGNNTQPDALKQLKNKYILTAVKSGLMMIDQRRAHERILYEQYIRSFAMNYPLAQRTLFPETIELDQSDYMLLHEIMEDLQVIGFDIRDFGNNTVVIAGYPEENHSDGPKDLLESFLEKFKSTETDIKVNVREKIARSMAVAGAVRYGETLSQEAMQELVDRLFGCESPGYSPSGKPVVVITSLDELEKKFK
jgi:DNA mismatch repair protein MutL